MWIAFFYGGACETSMKLRLVEYRVSLSVALRIAPQGVRRNGRTTLMKNSLHEAYACCAQHVKADVARSIPSNALQIRESTFLSVADQARLLAIAMVFPCIRAFACVL